MPQEQTRDDVANDPDTSFPIKFVPLALPGCFEVMARAAVDERGRFVKFFHAPSFAARKLEHRFVEAFYTTSQTGVIRGMHFQVPPREHAKLVCCIVGRVLDVLLDLRKGSPLYGEHVAIELDESVPRGLYIPPGVAHGFYTATSVGVVAYMVTEVHSPTQDTGIRWDSFGMKWPNGTPIVSARDADLVELSDFVSPFEYTEARGA